MQLLTCEGNIRGRKRDTPNIESAAKTLTLYYTTAKPSNVGKSRVWKNSGGGEEKSVFLVLVLVGWVGLTEMKIIKLCCTFA